MARLERATRLPTVDENEEQSRRGGAFGNYYGGDEDRSPHRRYERSGRHRFER
jgi:hypothetical protein